MRSIPTRARRLKTLAGDRDGIGAPHGVEIQRDSGPLHAKATLQLIYRDDVAPSSRQGRPDGLRARSLPAVPESPERAVRDVDRAIGQEIEGQGASNEDTQVLRNLDLGLTCLAIDAGQEGPLSGRSDPPLHLAHSARRQGCEALAAAVRPKMNTEGVARYDRAA